MLDWTHSQKQICRLRIKYKTLTWKLYSPHSFRRGGASFAFPCNVPAEIIQRQGDWQSDAYLIYLEMSSAQKRRAVNSMASHILQLSSPWCTIPFFSYTISSSQFHNISHNSRPFFISHNFGLGLFSFFGGSLLIQLRPLSLPVHSTAVESDSINLWPKPVVVWLLRGRDCAINTLVILTNYESIMWHRSAYPIISQLRLSVSHKLVVKGQAR